MIGSQILPQHTILLVLALDRIRSRQLSVISRKSSVKRSNSNFVKCEAKLQTLLLPVLVVVAMPSVVFTSLFPTEVSASSAWKQVERVSSLYWIHLSKD